MARAVPEWIGKTDDEAVPPRVRLRVADKDKWKCRECSRPLALDKTLNTDHVKAIINGGENRERNLQSLCDWCHAEKTKGDVAEKSRTHRARRRHYGVRGKPKGRPLAGTFASGIRKPIYGPPVWRDNGKPVGRR